MTRRRLRRTTNVHLDFPSGGDFFSHNREEPPGSLDSQKIPKLRAKIVHAKMVARNQPASFFSQKKTTAGDFPLLRQTAAEKKVHEKQWRVVFPSDLLEAATASFGRGATDAKPDDVHLPHHGRGPADGGSIGVEHCGCASFAGNGVPT